MGQQIWVRFGLLTGTLLLTFFTIGLWLDHYPVAFDLTEESRYTLSPATKKQLAELKAPLYVEIYLSGSLPASFRRLRKTLQDMLQRMDGESLHGIKMRDIDPTKGRNSQNKRAYILSLAEKGIQPTNLSYNEDNRRVERLIFPGIMLQYQGKELGVTLLKGSQKAGSEDMLNQSIERLEYELLTGIRKLLQPARRSLGYVGGHDNIDTLVLNKLRETLFSEGYSVKSIFLAQKSSPLEQMPLCLIVKPERTFSKTELYRIDQYLMHGGQLMIFAEGLRVAMDKVGEDGTVGLARPTGLEELLFHYGVRVQPQLLTDLYAARYPVITGQVGNGQVRLLAWPFFPVISKKRAHSITRNIESLLLRYGTRLDTVKASGISKKPLLWSSPQTKMLEAPALVALNQLKEPPMRATYQAGSQAVAYLLEGKFTSAFKNRPKPASEANFRAKGAKSRLIVVGDGDFPLGDPHPRSGKIMEIGMYFPENMQYGNRDFLLQALDYCYDANGAILARNRRVKLRPLDKREIEDSKLFWQLLNLLLPLGLVATFGVIKMVMRRARYA